MPSLRVTRQAVEVMAADPLPLPQLRVTRQTVEVMAADPDVLLASNALAVAQGATADNGIVVTAENNLALSAVTSPERATSNTLAMTQATSIRLATGRAAVSTLAITGAALGEIFQQAGSAISMVDAATVTASFDRTAAGALAIAQTASKTGTIALSAENSLSVSVSTSAVLGNSFSVSAESDLDDLDVAAATVLIPVGRVASTLALATSATSNIKSRDAASSLTPAQSATVSTLFDRSAATPIFFSETIVDPLSFNQLNVDRGIFDQAAAVVFQNPAPIETRLSFALLAEVVHVRNDGTDVAGENVLTFGHVAKISLTGDAENQLTIVASAIATAGPVASTDLSLSQSIGLSTNRNKIANSSLGLFQTANLVLLKETTEKDYSPFVGTTSDPGAPSPPPVTAPILENAAGIELFHPFDAPLINVALRGPELSNRDRLTFQRIHRETRGGTLILFADPQWPKIQQLVLEFTGLKEKEAQSLLTFLETSLGQEIGLRDWENRTWRGVLTSPQEPITRDGRTNLSTSLEFEGALA